MTDFRLLCAELLSALENEGYAHWNVTPDEDELCLRARAALAEPEPEPPTDEELKKLLYFEFTQSTGHGHSEDPIGFARAVLARWGNYPASPDSSTSPRSENV